jgi:hypothetical protein
VATHFQYNISYKFIYFTMSFEKTQIRKNDLKIMLMKQSSFIKILSVIKTVTFIYLKV